MGAEISAGCTDCIDRFFVVDPALPTGDPRTDKGVFPRFWLAGWILGQGSIVHGTGMSAEIRTDREALLSLDLISSDDDVEPRVRAEWDGRKVEPREPPVLRRDHSGVDPKARTTGKATVDFILPPVSEGGMKRLEVFLDAGSVGGYDAEPPPVWKVLTTDVQVRAFRPSRLLEIAVVPVQLMVPGYSAATPPAGPVEKATRLLIPAMTRVAASEMLAAATPTWRSPGVVSLFSRALLVAGLTGQLQAAMAAQQLATGYRPDLVVGVVAPGSLPGAASTMCDQGTVVLVGADRGDAVLHEIGHLAGMNCGPNELYLIDPPHGSAVTRLTAFNTEGNGFMTSEGDATRIVHLLAPDSPEWSRRNPWLAVMGDNFTQKFWPLASESGTLSAWLTKLDGWWPTPGTPARPGNPAVPAALPAGDPVRRIFAWGMIESAGNGPSPGWRLVPGTVRAVEIPEPREQTSGIGFGVEEPGSEGYLLRATSPTGVVGLEQGFSVRPRTGGDPATAAPVWWASFDVPAWVDAWRIVGTSDGATVFEVPAAAGPTVAIRSPAPGALLDGTFEVRWDGGDYETADPGGIVPFHQPVQYRVQFSRDGGRTFVEAPGTVERNSATFDAGFLEGSGTVSIRVLATDGIRTAQDQVDHLRAPDRPPVVRVAWPAPGTRAAPGTPWTLRGESYDPEGEMLAPGSWSSDRDGPLGTGESLQGVVLSRGSHRLSYVVRDRAGQEGGAWTDVVVEDLDVFDASLEDGALAIHPPDREAFSDAPPVLVPGKTHGATLRFQAPGTAWTGTLSLEWAPPGGGYQVLAEEEMSLRTFEAGTLAATFVPETEGDYRFRGRLLAADPADPVPANDVREWGFSTRPPALLEADPPGLDCGSALPGGPGIAKALALRNGGGRDLSLGSLSVRNEGAFTLESDGCSGKVLAAGEHCDVSVRFRPDRKGVFEGTLEIPSDDPRGSPAVVGLRGTGVGRFRLTVFLPGTGEGTVSSEPPGIACPPSCTAPFDPGTPVVLRAHPGSGASFEGWEGGGCTGTGACTVTLDRDLAVGARFAGPGTGGPDGWPDGMPPDILPETPETSGGEIDAPGGGRSGGCRTSPVAGPGRFLLPLPVLAAWRRRAFRTRIRPEGDREDCGRP